MSARIRYGCPGHETEYMVHDPRYTAMGDYFPYSTERNLTNLLPEGWSVLNRGSRMEIIPSRADRFRDSTYPIVLNAVQAVIGPVHEFTVDAGDHVVLDVLNDQVLV